MFSSRELAQLDVYGLWAVLRWQLATDDSFTFNKVAQRLLAKTRMASKVSCCSACRR